jgi:hypothetical protein
MGAGDTGAIAADPYLALMAKSRYRRHSRARPFTLMMVVTRGRLACLLTGIGALSAGASASSIRHDSSFAFAHASKLCRLIRHSFGPALNPGISPLRNIRTAVFSCTLSNVAMSFGTRNCIQRQNADSGVW